VCAFLQVSGGVDLFEGDLPVGKVILQDLIGFALAMAVFPLNWPCGHLAMAVFPVKGKSVPLAAILAGAPPRKWILYLR